MASKNGTSGADPLVENMPFPTWLEGKSNRLPTMERVKRLCGPLSVREALGLSASEMVEALSYFGVNVQHRQAIYTWELAERDPDNLPRRYWKQRATPKKAREAYQKLIVSLAECSSRGKCTARVHGVRTWRVTVVRVGGK